MEKSRVNISMEEFIEIATQYVVGDSGYISCIEIECEQCPIKNDCPITTKRFVCENIKDDRINYVKKKIKQHKERKIKVELWKKMI